jgi:AraC-like DNA-binding protein
MLIEREGQPSSIKPARGDAVLIPSNCWNRPDGTEASTVLNLLFGRNQIGLSLVQHDGRGVAPPHVVKTTVHGSLDGPVADMLNALLGLATNTGGAAALLVEALLKTCLEMMLRPNVARAGKSEGFYESLCMYIQEHFHLPLSRSSVAEHFRVSPNHISRVFKKNGRVTFNNYVNYSRVDRAKYLLKLHNQTVDEISAACGYADTAYFCRVFKAKTKLTPTTYRQRARG